MVKKIPGEYAGVSKTMAKLGLYDLCTKAHATPVTPYEMVKLTRKILGPNVRIVWRGKRGKAIKRGHKLYTISYPKRRFTRSDSVESHRLGLVLHECAHVLVFITNPDAEPHGEEFCCALAKLLVLWVGGEDGAVSENTSDSEV